MSSDSRSIEERVTALEVRMNHISDQLAKLDNTFNNMRESFVQMVVNQNKILDYFNYMKEREKRRISLRDAFILAITSSTASAVITTLISKLLVR